MKLALRSLTAILAAALLVLPGIGNDPGGNGAGGTGVWILPAQRYIGSTPITTQTSSTAPSFALSSLDSDITLTAASMSTAFTALLIDDVSGHPLPLPVQGRDVMIGRAVLQELAAAGVTTSHIVIADANQSGYVVRVAIDLEKGSGTLTVR